MITPGNRLGIAFLGVSIGCLIAAIILRPKVPGIVEELRAIPHVAHVGYQHIGSGETRLVVVHLRDWHFVPRNLCELEGISFEEVLTVAKAVQESQVAIARHLIRSHGLKDVYAEGLSEKSRPMWDLRLDVLKTVPPEALAKESDTVKYTALEVGTPGRLLLAGDIANVLPLEDERAHQDAKPVVDGKVAPNDAKIAARRKAMVARLPAEGMALIVLGGSHDLGPQLPAGTLYVQVTPRGYPD